MVRGQLPTPCDEPRNRPLGILIAVGGVSFLLACAAQAPPQPPRVERPEPINDLAVAQVGRAVEISFTLPRLAADGERLTKPLEIEIFRSITAPGQKSPDEPAGQSSWMTLGAEDLVRHGRGEKIELTRPFSEDDFNRWRGATLTFWARGLTRGFHHRAITSEFSKPFAATLLNVSGPVENFEVVTREKALELRWSAPRGSEVERGPGTLSGYLVYKSTTGAPGSFQQLPEAGSTTYVDRNFEFNHAYFFKVRAVFRNNGQVGESADSRLVEITPRDVFPPEAPQGLSGIYTAAGVEVIWTANSEPDLGGYNVYRREGEEPPRRLNPELIRTPIFRDTQVQAGHQYAYRVTAVDLSNNESQPSTETVIEAR